MKELILRTGICLLKIIYLPFSLCRIQNKITYLSRQSDHPSQDFQILRETSERLYPEVENVVLCRMVSEGAKSKYTYPFHMLQQMYHLATSRAVIIDGYCIIVSLLPHKKETTVIQIWHASAAIKKFGYQILDKPSGRSSKIARIMQMHKNYDYVIAPSKATAEVFSEGFQIDPKKILIVGAPHLSVLLQNQDEALEKAYPELKEKKNILYIPTFRKGKTIQMEELLKGVDFDRYNLIVRLHPLDRVESRDGRVIYDADFSIYDWIRRAEIIVNDYSSLLVECAAIRKELYFYLYDYEEYREDPGVNLDFAAEGLDRYAFRTGEEFQRLLEEPYDAEIVDRFAGKYIEVTLKHNAEKILETALRGGR